MVFGAACAFLLLGTPMLSGEECGQNSVPNPSNTTTVQFMFGLNITLATDPESCGGLGASKGIEEALEAAVQEALTNNIFGDWAYGSTGEVCVDVNVFREAITVTSIGPQPNYITSFPDTCGWYKHDSRPGGSEELVDLTDPLATVPSEQPGLVSDPLRYGSGSLRIATINDNAAKGEVGFNDQFGMASKLFNDSSLRLRYSSYKVPHASGKESATPAIKLTLITAAAYAQQDPCGSADSSCRAPDWMRGFGQLIYEVCFLQTWDVRFWYLWLTPTNLQLDYTPHKSHHSLMFNQMREQTEFRESENGTNT